MRIAPMTAATVAVLAGTLLLPAAPARASEDGLALNGTYRAFSDGQWAKTNGRYEDQASATATWSVSSTCSSYLDCTGTVTSDQGWTAPLTYDSGIWRVKHPVDRWWNCPDGTAATGQQSFVFWPGQRDPATLVGFDKTVGPSGACGVNRPLTIDMPFTLTPT